MEHIEDLEESKVLKVSEDLTEDLEKDLTEDIEIIDRKHRKKEEKVMKSIIKYMDDVRRDHKFVSNVLEKIRKLEESGVDVGECIDNLEAQLLSISSKLSEKFNSLLVLNEEMKKISEEVRPPVRSTVKSPVKSLVK